MKIGANRNKKSKKNQDSEISKKKKSKFSPLDDDDLEDEEDDDEDDEDEDDDDGDEEGDDEDDDDGDEDEEDDDEDDDDDDGEPVSGFLLTGTEAEKAVKSEERHGGSGGKSFSKFRPDFFVRKGEKVEVIFLRSSFAAVVNCHTIHQGLSKKAGPWVDYTVPVKGKDLLARAGSSPSLKEVWIVFRLNGRAGKDGKIYDENTPLYYVQFPSKTKPVKELAKELAGDGQSLSSVVVRMSKSENTVTMSVKPLKKSHRKLIKDAAPAIKELENEMVKWFAPPTEKTMRKIVRDYLINDDDEDEIDD